MKEDFRVILIVLDSCGVGELPDAFEYGDRGSNTLLNTAKEVGGLKLPNLERLGLGNVQPIKGVFPQKNPLACYGKMGELSAGKDSTISRDIRGTRHRCVRKFLDNDLWKIKSLF